MEGGGSQLLKSLVLRPESNGAKRAYNRPVFKESWIQHSSSLQGIKVMRVSWLDTTFHITVTNIKSIREKLIRAVPPPLYPRETVKLGLKRP